MLYAFVKVISAAKPVISVECFPFPIFYGMIIKYMNAERRAAMLTQNLSEKQIEAVNTIDDDVGIIACAGVGKTGVVTRRIINILKCKPNITTDNVIAFTFTKKAA